jgi:F420H(2)-dependent quinone reductase
MDLLRAADRSWPVLRRVMAGHTAVYRLTRGVIGHKVPGGPPMLLLDHVGAKSGTKRTSPLVYVRDGDDIVLVASKGGNPKNPAWFHNLKANPETTIQIGSEKRPVRARIATDEERKRLWPKAVKTYSGYDGYQKRTDRKIPLVVLERR